MDSKESTQTSENSIVKHIFKFDDETKSNLMNLTQYIILAIIPVAILQNLSEKLFPKYDSSKGTVELLAEIIGQSVTTLIGLFFIHRIITAVPTFSGTAMGDLNLFNIIVVFLLTSFMFDGKIQQKFDAVSERTIDVWEGKSADTKDKKKQQKDAGQSVVKVSQPISGPAHQGSRSDYIGMQTGLGVPQGPPPSIQTQQQQQPSIADQPNYAGELGAPPVIQEPMAANSVLGGGSFAAW